MRVRRLCKTACSAALAVTMALMSPLATLAAQIDESDEEIIVVEESSAGDMTDIVLDDLFNYDTGNEVAVGEESVDEAIPELSAEGSQGIDTDSSGDDVDPE